MDTPCIKAAPPRHCTPVGSATRQDAPGTAPRRLPRDKVRPARHKTPFLGHFSCAGRTSSRSRPPSERAGRTFSRARRGDVAILKPTTPLQPLMQVSMKPPSPLRAPEQQPMKPTTPLRPTNAPKPPDSHPQRRHRFQPQARTSEQRRQGFQGTEPPGLRGLAAVPVGGGGAWPGFKTTRRAEGSRRGRLAGGPPPTGTHSGPAPTKHTRRLEITRAAGPSGARNTSGATSTATGKGKPTAPGTP